MRFVDGLHVLTLESSVQYYIVQKRVYVPSSAQKLCLKLWLDLRYKTESQSVGLLKKSAQPALHINLKTE